MNYECAKLGEWGHKMGAVIRDSTGAVWWVAVNQNVGCVEPKYVEAKACKWAMEQALEHGVSSIIMEGDYQSLTSKLKKRECPNNELGLLIQNILHIVS